ncbi:MAG: hypothetical protein WD470_06275 [Rhodospirillaceae bacterium]
MGLRRLFVLIVVGIVVALFARAKAADAPPGSGAWQAPPTAEGR